MVAMRVHRLAARTHLLMPHWSFLQRWLGRHRYCGWSAGPKQHVVWCVRFAPHSPSPTILATLVSKAAPLRRRCLLHRASTSQWLGQGFFFQSLPHRPIRSIWRTSCQSWNGLCPGYRYYHLIFRSAKSAGSSSSRGPTSYQYACSQRFHPPDFRSSRCQWHRSS